MFSLSTASELHDVRCSLMQSYRPVTCPQSEKWGIPDSGDQKPERRGGKQIGHGFSHGEANGWQESEDVSEPRQASMVRGPDASPTRRDHGEARPIPTTCRLQAIDLKPLRTAARVHVFNLPFARISSILTGRLYDRSRAHRETPMTQRETVLERAEMLKEFPGQQVPEADVEFLRTGRVWIGGWLTAICACHSGTITCGRRLREGQQYGIWGP